VTRALGWFMLIAGLSTCLGAIVLAEWPTLFVGVMFAIIGYAVVDGTETDSEEK